jgi:hypothetical protein
MKTPYWDALFIIIITIAILYFPGGDVIRKSLARFPMIWILASYFAGRIITDMSRSRSKQ